MFLFVIVGVPEGFLGFFSICGVLYGVVGFAKTFGKTNNRRKRTYPRVGLKLLTTVCFWLSRRFVWLSLVFFVFVWLSRSIVWFCKNLRENKKKQKKRKTISKGESETLNNFVFCCFPEGILVVVGFL